MPVWFENLNQSLFEVLLLGNALINGHYPKKYQVLQYVSILFIYAYHQQWKSYPLNIALEKKDVGSCWYVIVLFRHNVAYC